MFGECDKCDFDDLSEVCSCRCAQELWPVVHFFLENRRIDPKSNQFERWLE